MADFEILEEEANALSPDAVFTDASGNRIMLIAGKSLLVRSRTDVELLQVASIELAKLKADAALNVSSDSPAE
jgi:hypothetical protein